MLMKFVLGIAGAALFICGWIAKPEDVEGRRNGARMRLHDQQFHEWLASQADETGKVCVVIPGLAGHKQGDRVYLPTPDSEGRYIDPHTGKIRH